MRIRVDRYDALVHKHLEMQRCIRTHTHMQRYICDCVCYATHIDTCVTSDEDIMQVVMFTGFFIWALCHVITWV